MTIAHTKPFQQPQGQGQRFNSFDKLRDVVQPRSELPDVVRRKPQPQPAPLSFNGEFNSWYKTVRNGVESRIYLIDVRKDVVTFKDTPEDKHSQTISLAKFLKFYKAV